MSQNSARTPRINDLANRIDVGFREALLAAMGESAAATDPSIKVAANPKFGDFQANFAMGLAKSLATTLGKNPREVAQLVVDHLPQSLRDLCEPMEIAGPGFV
ncbi:MAG: hypothetical protein RLZZ386_340, partial [Planctomycetota bacterium]